MRNMIATLVTAMALTLTGALFAPSPALAKVESKATASGEYVVAHPKYSGVCGDGWTWKQTGHRAKHNKPRIMTYRIFTKGPRGFCVVVAHAGDAIGATGPTLAALVTDDYSRVSKGYFAYYAVVKMRGNPCLRMTAVVRYGEQQAVREGAFMCGR